MIFFLAIIILAILAFSVQADGKSLSKEDVNVAIIVVIGTIALLAIGKLVQATF